MKIMLNNFNAPACSIHWLKLQNMPRPNKNEKQLLHSGIKLHIVNIVISLY